jgi:hypothetical protein
VDSLLGYVPGNVLVVSWLGNCLKSDYSVEMICRMADYLRNRAEIAS